MKLELSSSFRKKKKKKKKKKNTPKKKKKKKKKKKNRIARMIFKSFNNFRKICSSTNGTWF